MHRTTTCTLMLVLTLGACAAPATSGADLAEAPTCTRVEPDGAAGRPVGDAATAARLVEAELPAALRTDGLAIVLDGEEVGSIELGDGGGDGAVTAAAWEYCLPPDVDPRPAEGDGAPYGSWVLAEDDATDQPDDTTTTLELRATSADGTTACNHYDANTTADVEGRFRVTGLSRDEMSCGNDLDAAEARYAEALAAVDRWELTDDGDLLLHGPTTTLRFRPA